ncbi:hybrid sensor histidine kinase/response regulator [Ramlibacter sp. AN1133]|uniref:hybrid sensor histidine kinase/response regulator n=1 Tax=Ramlibacter sp. AN1133 TaxID=3133429 RepID=UPI0030C1BAD4
MDSAFTGSPQAELLLALDASDTGLWTWDLAGQGVTWTSVCYRLLGLPEDDAALTFDAFLARIHADDRARVREEIAQCVRSGQTLATEFRALRPDGALRWLAASGRCIAGDDGTPERMAGSMRDITEPKHTRQVLHDSQERLRLAVESSGIGLWTWDLATEAVTWSSEAYRIHGLEHDAFGGTGAAFFALVHPADRQRVEQAVREALARNHRYQCEFRIVRPDGSIAWVANGGRARYDADGNAVGMLGTISDVTATRHAELAMQAALEASSAGTFRWDIRTNELWWDDALDRLFGLTPGASVRSLEQFIARVHPDDRAGVIARCERCRTDGANFDMEFRIVRPDGSERWLYDRGRTFRDHAGRPASMTGACVDITHRKHTELALRRSESFYRQTLESLPGMTFTTTRDGWWDYLSEQWQTYTGIPSSQLLGHSWPSALHPDDRPAMVARFDWALARKEGCDVECRVRGADGTYRWFKVRCQPILDPSGELASWIGTAVDVHELQQAQEALAASEERLRRAQRAGGIGVWEWNMETQLAFWTEQTATLMGCRPPSLEQVPDEFWRDAIHPEDLARIQQHLCDAYVTRHFHDEFRTMRADGSVAWLESDAELVGGEDGRPLKLVGSVRDVSERHRAEEALRQADRLKDEFLATLAHELRNPLAALRSGLHLLQVTQGSAAPQQEKTHGMMERQLTHLVRLVDDLLDVSRISQGKLAIRRERVDMADVLAQAIETAHELIEARGHRLALDLPPEPLCVTGDATRLAQVAANLLLNAAKYTPDGGDIRATVREADGEVELSVADNGLGIAPEMQARVFDLFVQVGTQWQPGMGGLGIGLALVRRLVELHGGSIRVHSAGEGQGSTFTVRLPAAPLAAGSEPAPVAPAAAASDVRPIRVMVVDDNVDAAEAMSLLLELTGHEVRVAADGQSALKGAREFRPAVTFLDIGLPGMSGYEVARTLKADPELREGILVAVTGWGSDEDKRKCLDAGFDLHLTKPVEPAAMEQVLAAWAGRERVAK